MLGQLILLLINTPLLLLAVWISSRNQHQLISLFTFLSHQSFIKPVAGRTEINILNGADFSPFALAWVALCLMCLHFLLAQLIAVLCEIALSALNLKLRVSGQTHHPCVIVVLWLATFSRRADPSAGATCCPPCMSEGFSSIHYMLGC